MPPGWSLPDACWETGNEAVIATHVDRGHLHCHILFNSVSFVDGKKYRNSFKDYFGDIRETSNQVSREQGLSTIQPQGKGEPYPAWQAEQTAGPPCAPWCGRT